MSIWKFPKKTLGILLGLLQNMAKLDGNRTHFTRRSQVEFQLCFSNRRGRKAVEAAVLNAGRNCPPLAFMVSFREI